MVSYAACSGLFSQVKVLARAQSCICWTSEAQAAADAWEPILEICWYPGKI